MSKTSVNFAARIARIGRELATRQRSAKADIVVERPKHLKPLVKYMGLYLNASDYARLNEIEMWARQNGLRAGRGTLLKAGIRLLRTDEASLNALRQVIEGDGRRQV